MVEHINLEIGRVSIAYSPLLMIQLSRSKSFLRN